MSKWVGIVSVFFHLSVFGQISFQSSPNLLPLTPHFSGSVIGIADMNADGLDDIVRLGQSRLLSILYQNAPGKPFTERSFGPIATYEFWNITIADINQDGYNDMVFAANENPGYTYYSRLIKDSITYQIQVLAGSNQAYAQAGNLVDINNDGWLDYFLCNDLGENMIWLNDRHGSINNNPVSLIDFSTIPTSDKSGNYGSVWSDLDNDGDLDLYIAKCKGGATEPTDPRRINTLYQQMANDTFVESAAAAGLAISDQSWVAVTGDSDNDGDQDIFVINHLAPCRLLLNVGVPGQMKFVDWTDSSGITYNGIGVQAAWVDLDQDGLLDLIISGSTHQIYRNKGRNKFELVNSNVLGINPIESFSFGDLNGDGKIDIYASYSEVFNQASSRPDQIWLNNSISTNHFVKVRLEGKGSNRSAVGAKIKVIARGHTQTKEIQSGTSYGISTTLTQTLGIGDATKIDSIIIQWPDKSTEVIVSPFVDKTLFVKQNDCFATDPVLLKVPSKSILCGDKDSVTLTIPLTGEYSWNTGSTARAIIAKSEGQWQAKIVNAAGCTLYSNKVAIDKDSKPISKVFVADSVICAKSTTSISITTSDKILWNTGATTPEIIVSEAGSYYATVTQTCGTTQSDTAYIRVLTPAALIVKNDTVGLSAKANLSVIGTAISWYATPEDTKPFHTGNTYLTPPLDKTLTYFVQSTSTQAGKVYQGGIKDFSGDTKYHAANFSGKLFFDVNRPAFLQSVKVYADTAGTREIILINGAGETISSKLIRIEKGESRVVLNFALAIGTGYALATKEETSVKIFGTKSPLLYRTDGPIAYPLTAGPITLTGTNAGQANYYYFYAWQVADADLVCAGDRVPIMAVLKSTVSTQNELNSKIKIYPNPITNDIHIELSPELQNERIQIAVFNNVGQCVLLKEEKYTAKELNISNIQLRNGVYFLKITAGTKQGLSKIIVLN